MNDIQFPTNGGQHIPQTDQPSYVWPGGTIRGIYTYPPTADFRASDYRYWIGTATIDQSSDYSDYSGFDRLHMPLAGNGLRLHFDDPAEMVELTNLDQFTFAGGRPVHAELIDGSVLAFNIIAQTGLKANITLLPLGQNTETLQLSSPTDESPDTTIMHYVFYTVNGQISLAMGQGRNELLLNPGDAFALNQTDAMDAIDLAGLGDDTLVLVVSVAVTDDV